MQSFVDWFTASRLRVMVGAALFATLAYLPFLLTWLPGALIVLLALRGDRPLAAWHVAVFVTAMMSWLLLAAGAGPIPAVLVSAGLVVPPLLIGRFLARGGSLAIAFQFTTVAMLGLIVAVYLIFSDPPGVWQPFVERLAASLDQAATMMSTSDRRWQLTSTELREAAADFVSWGAAGSLLLINAIVAAALGIYAHGRQTRSAELGPAFRALKLGRTLATATLAVLLVSILVHWEFLRDVRQVFMGALVLQGLALLHATREILGLGTGWLAASYALLLIPSTALFAQPVLVVAGLLDNWLPLRERLARLAAKNKGQRS